MKLDHRLKKQIEKIAVKIDACLETVGAVDAEYAKTLSDLTMAQLGIYQAAHLLVYAMNGLNVADLPETDPKVDFAEIKKTWNTGNEN